VEIVLRDLNGGQDHVATYDAVILATGYRRDYHRSLLDPLSSYMGDFSVDRHYRLQSAPNFRPAIFLQGACESSHGLSDTLLSVTAVRTDEIGQALVAAVSRQSAQQAGNTVRAVASR